MNRPTARLGLAGVTPWGRRAYEYLAFFGLRADQLQGTVLDCGAGPSSFTAEMTRAGVDVRAVDPGYRLEIPAMRRLLADAEYQIGQALATERDRFVWDFYGDIDGLLAARRQAADRFFSDYPRGRATGRYICGELPRLPFPASRFDLALCSHLLFLYGRELDLDFHLSALSELTRVAVEVRVFPMVSLDGTPSPHVDACRQFLERRNVRVAIEPVPFEFQRGADHVFRAWRPAESRPIRRDRTT